MPRWSAFERATAVAACTLTAVVTLAACSGSSGGPSASDVVRELGAVPVPTAPRSIAPATANGTRPALVEMGAPVDITLPGLSATVTALGPEQSTTYQGGSAPPTRTLGTFTITAAVHSGHLELRDSDVSSRDQTGAVVTLRPVGRTTASVAAGQSGRLSLQGSYGSGAAQLTLAAAGRPLAVWDFNIELD